MLIIQINFLIRIFKKKVVSLKLPSKQIQIVFYVRKYLSYPTGMTST